MPVPEPHAAEHHDRQSLIDPASGTTGRKRYGAAQVEILDQLRGPAFEIGIVAETAGDLLEWLILPVGGLAIARAFWASSARAIEERTTALLDTVSRSLADPAGESGDE